MLSDKLPAIFVAMAMMLTVYSCNPDGVELSRKYPDYIGKIMRRNCSIKGCHTQESALAAGGLNLETWQDLFAGASGGSAVIPYASDQSYLMYAINTDTTLGPTLSPTMPIGRPALSRQEYLDIRQWIDDGARNEDGKERFPPLSQRRKWYVGNRGCDLVAVFDAESRQIMRYVKVGNHADRIEEPYRIVVSPDQQSWFVVFASFTPHVEQYSTLTDEKIRDIPLGYNGWNSMTLSPDGVFGFILAEYLKELVCVDLQTGTVIGGPVHLPENVHGPAVHPNRQVIYAPSDLSSKLFTIEYSPTGTLGQIDSVDLIQHRPSTNQLALWPYQVLFLPNGSKYYVLCWQSNEVRIYDGNSDALLEVISVGANPSGMAYSAATNRLFVACTEDTSSTFGASHLRGSIAVIDCLSDQLLKEVYAGFQPYGIGVDDVSGYAIVANRNLRQDGPASHHLPICAGRNGYVSLLNVNSLEMVNGYKVELTVDPSSVAIKKMIGKM